MVNTSLPFSKLSKYFMLYFSIYKSNCITKWYSKCYNLTITCTDPGNTGNTRYQWLNSTGSKLTSTVSQNQVPLALSFTNIKRTDSGVYICRATNHNTLPRVNMNSNVNVFFRCTYCFY